MRNNIFAHTETGHDYPAYLSINSEVDGKISVTVRTSGESSASVINLAPNEFAQMRYALNKSDYNSLRPETSD